MKAKLLALLAQLKAAAAQLQLKGVLCGVALGYLCHPVIKVAVGACVAVVKGLLKI